ncbi:MAG TPA: hypothetical protein VHG08_11345 [Longimicrobium sp.]|nr:hypothetical protein [Longimicrobium sp.]
MIGCQDQPATGPARSVPSATASTGAAVSRLDEAEMAAFARAVPGLGGYYFGPEGELVVNLTPAADPSAAQGALAAVARRGNGRVQARPASYTFLELQAWRDALVDPLLALAEVASVDLDEEHNRVTVGVTTDAARGAVHALAAQLGVPVPALRIVPGSYVVPQDTTVYGPYLYTTPVEGNTLNGYRSVLEGGLQLGFRREGMEPNTFTFCTLGFNAVLNGYRVVITNTHCSDKTWDRDNTAYFQPQPGDGRHVGFEYKDPNGSSCGFLSPNVCRSADASAAYVESTVSTRIGYIARPLGPPPFGRSPYGTLYGSTVIDAAAPNFQIVGKHTADEGLVVDKVGAVTGWTSGKVTSTCVDVKVRYRSWSVMRCQKYATYSSTGGDSGAPVFEYYPDGTVRLVGIHWGETDDRSRAVFSSIANVENELGSLFVTAGSGGGSTGGGDGGGATTPPPGDGTGGGPGGCAGECVT